MIDGVLYASTAFSQVAAIDAGSGATRWVFDPHAYQVGRRPANSGWQHRGVAYWSGKVAGRAVGYCDITRVKVVHRLADGGRESDWAGICRVATGDGS